MKKLCASLLLLVPAIVYAGFSDVPTTHKNYHAISYLEQHKIVQGYNDGTFKPDASINRAEFLKIIVTSQFSPEEIDSLSTTMTLHDVGANTWFHPYVAFALQNNIVGGYPDGTFRPAHTINFAEALKITLETYDVPLPQYVKAPDHWYDPYLDGAASAGILVNISDQRPEHLVTRGELAELIVALQKKDTAGEPLAVDHDTPMVTWMVSRVVDGDTVYVTSSDGKEEKIRMIGMNTPEMNPKECYAEEATALLATLVDGQEVDVQLDESQGERDKYERLLAYLFVGNANINQQMIEAGAALEYTYNTPYKYQSAFQQAELQAKEAKKGLWNEQTCPLIEDTVTTEEPVITTNCVIKGNISSSTKEKIYHYPGCQSYEQTVITEAKGERWFCTKTEAEAAGWRAAKNC